MKNPKLIQGGMGVAVSAWPLARAVSQMGHLGVVSGTALAVVLIRRLQLGDVGGHYRRAMAAFPFPEVADRVLMEYFVPGGKSESTPFRLTPIPNIPLPRSLVELTVLANFAEVYLAKEGHSGLVGVNYLEKVQIPTLPSLYGAMLAGVDYVLMGAGIPLAIPGILDRLARGEGADMRIYLEEDSGPETRYGFEPRQYFGQAPIWLKRPKFLAIIASATLATTLVRKATGSVEGFVVEGPRAGGHNAPPRGALRLDGGGEPVYGARDEVDLEKIRALGLPFWLAGSYADPHRFTDALARGAAGVQVGTAFAFCAESGIDERLKKQVLERVSRGDVKVRTDPLASPTGFPFKVVVLPRTASDDARYAARTRICDLGYLRQPYRRKDGIVGYRCPAEPVEDFIKKGGTAAATAGRKCLCNCLMATVGAAQAQHTGPEDPIVTAGDDLLFLGRFLSAESSGYTAADVVRHVLATPEG
jgi:nitronate monooxygenase